jgi:hypothetical protein
LNLDAQIIYLGCGLFILALIFTIAARYNPKGAQPAAYGNIKTLLRLVDDWQREMYWGHKDDGPPCHAGAMVSLYLILCSEIFLQARTERNFSL